MKKAACIRLLSAINARHPSVPPSRSSPKVPSVPIVPFKRFIVPSYDEQREGSTFSPASQASRASSARIRLFRQRAFARRSAFWKTSTSLPVSWRPLPLFHVSFPARTFRRKPSPEPMPVFFSFSFYFFYRVCSLPEREAFRENPPSPSGNAAYLLYAGSLVH